MPSGCGCRRICVGAWALGDIALLEISSYADARRLCNDSAYFAWFAVNMLSPHLSPVQLAAARQKYPPVPAVCAVTGGTGFVGARLVEMLVERGAKRVRVLDVVPPPPTAWQVRA